MDLQIQFLFIAISVGWIQCHQAYLNQFPTDVIPRINAVKDPYCKLIAVTPARSDAWMRVGHNAISATHAASSSLRELKNSRNPFGKVSTIHLILFSLFCVHRILKFIYK